MSYVFYAIALYVFACTEKLMAVEDTVLHGVLSDQNRNGFNTSSSLMHSLAATEVNTLKE